MRKVILTVVTLALLWGAGATWEAAAQGAFPQRAVRLVVPFAAGGNTDLVARLVGAGMSEQLGQQVVIENKTGSGSVIAAEYVAQAPADGYTLLYNTVAHAVSPALYKKLAFDPVKSFQPVALVARSPLILVVNTRLGVKDAPDLVARLRAEPGKHTFGTGGNGAAEHLAGELLKQLAKLDIVHVPYRGGAPALNDLVAGQISLMITPISAAMPHVKAGTVQGLAVSTTERVAMLPELPTIAESGVPGYDAYTWNAIYAPAGTPRAIVDRLNQAANQAVATPAIAQKIRDLANEPIEGSTPESLARFLAAEMTKWITLIQTAGVTPD
jgi:tripartite-type tricarboxylate transporter receptor subunit TctC